MKSFSLPPVRVVATCAIAVSAILGTAACSKPEQNVTSMGIEFERDGTALTYRESGQLGWVDLSCNGVGVLNVEVVDGDSWTVVASGSIAHTSCEDRKLEPGEIRRNEIPYNLRG